MTAYKLTGSLESAIRASNAQYDKADVLDRLRLKMLPHSGGEARATPGARSFDLAPRTHPRFSAGGYRCSLAGPGGGLYAERLCALRAPCHFQVQTGWDVFTLEYLMTAPLTTVFTPDVMARGDTLRCASARPCSGAERRLRDERL